MFTLSGVLAVLSVVFTVLAKVMDVQPIGPQGSEVGFAGINGFFARIIGVHKLWYYLNVIGLMALCFSGRIPYMKRINHYFAAPHFLFLPLMIRCEERPVRRRALYVLIVLLFLAETIVAVGYLNKNGVLPYQTVFQADRVTMTDNLLMTIVP